MFAPDAGQRCSHPLETVGLQEVRGVLPAPLPLPEDSRTLPKVH